VISAERSAGARAGLNEVSVTVSRECVTLDVRRAPQAAASPQSCPSRGTTAASRGGAQPRPASNYWCIDLIAAS